MTVKRVGIVGSGIMGSGIAEVAAKSGHEVVLRSRKQETADKMVAGLEKSLAKQVDKGKLSDEDRQGTLQRAQEFYRQIHDEARRHGRSTAPLITPSLRFVVLRSG